MKRLKEWYVVGESHSNHRCFHRGGLNRVCVRRERLEYASCERLLAAWTVVTVAGGDAPVCYCVTYALHLCYTLGIAFFFPFPALGKCNQPLLILAGRTNQVFNISTCHTTHTHSQREKEKEPVALQLVTGDLRACHQHHSRTATSILIL